jgi:hypothetical protein
MEASVIGQKLESSVQWSTLFAFFAFFFFFFFFFFFCFSFVSPLFFFTCHNGLILMEQKKDVSSETSSSGPGFLDQLHNVH